MIRRMTPSELDLALDWAAREGWNPGLDDAAAFLEADPQGFFVAEQDGVPVAAISVVNHSEVFAFLGLYICRPEYRGRGVGLALWTEALRHAGDRCVGLDGVADQQANYARSGFVRTGETMRYLGAITGRPSDRVRSAEAADLPTLLQMDAVGNGVARTSYARAWFSAAPRRHTLVLPGDSGLAGYVTVRACREGAKLGPLWATTEEDAATLMAAAATVETGPVSIDVPDTAPQLADLVQGMGMTPAFGTARMYRGTPPAATPPAFFAVTTLELG